MILRDTGAVAGAGTGPHGTGGPGDMPPATLPDTRGRAAMSSPRSRQVYAGGRPSGHGPARMDGARRGHQDAISAGDGAGAGRQTLPRSMPAWPDLSQMPGIRGSVPPPIPGPVCMRPASAGRIPRRVAGAVPVRAPRYQIRMAGSNKVVTTYDASADRDKRKSRSRIRGVRRPDGGALAWQARTPRA